MNIQEIREFGNLELLAKQLVEGFITGLHKSPYHGFSVEFAEHRLYNPGESTRHIDWKVYARTDKLFTKVFDEETNLRCSIILDNSPSMHYPKDTKAKLAFSTTAAAALCYLLQKQRDAFGLISFSEELEIQTPIKSSGSHLHKILLTLDELQKSETPSSRNTNIAINLHQIASKLNKRSLVILFTDMFEHGRTLDETFEALEHLKHNMHEVLIFHVTDHKTELNFEFENKPHEFIDMETGEKIKLNPSAIQESYTQNMNEYFKEIKLRCGQAKIDLIEVNTQDKIEKILAAYLVKRSKMK
ncbi:DUF58 domain-containing protein [Aureibacter tunicatorum]|uniref:Uncharacterized protein (DUF58 family) n=1 Tax=Aureibacter tunicatorum TaxID=866807 RepID=A0AAE3XLY5_9BACT|nr:DUF58 domain-containing protein [Aureibacter tunicatorum]MDR6238380.1 uncharacterized protein (DUF58 family) [Aureibacter tunicatorum]BDD03412.1 hypothetical protein AUTU_08950 [Aureibacter tunicatorum]